MDFFYYFIVNNIVNIVLILEMVFYILNKKIEMIYGDVFYVIIFVYL